MAFFTRFIFKIQRRHVILLSVVGVLCLVGIGIITTYSISPSSFVRNTMVRIEQDMTITEAAHLLKEKEIIRSVRIFKVYVWLVRGNIGVQAGTYLFSKPQSALRVAYRTAYGVKEIEKIKLTISEGSNSKEIAELLDRRIPDFDVDSFYLMAKEREGYLFPETYFVDPDVKPKEIVQMMTDQFAKSVDTLQKKYATSTRSFEDILVMASIIEEEANNIDDRRIISGILWKRIDEGMALQVDAPFYYLYNKGSSQLTRQDLAEKNPYNTYVNKGLPPGPISNPGLEAIEAAYNPEPTKYYYYLADREGVTHYATSHDGHVVNKQKYLR